MRPSSLILALAVSAVLSVDATAAAPASPGQCDVNVLVSGALGPAVRALAPQFMRSQGKTLCVIDGPSGGPTPTAIPNRLARGEPADLVIITRASLDDVAGKGLVVQKSQTDLVNSSIYMAVRKGASKPDISTPERFKQALLNAKSVIVADGFSGVYLIQQVFPRLGIAAEMAGKTKSIAVTPVAVEVSAGRAELGFQQLSELRADAGVEVAGPLPAAYQLVTVYSAGIAAAAKDPQGARDVMQFLLSEAAWPAFRNAGLEPARAAQ